MSERLTKSLTDVITEELNSNSNVLESSVNTNTNTFLGLTFTTWIIIILILALLGINIFNYLAKGTEETTNILNKYLGPIFKWVGYKTLDTTKQTIDVSAIGAKTGIDIVADTTTKSIDISAKGAKSGIDIITDTSTIPIKNINKNKNIYTNDSVPVQDTIQQNHYDSDSWTLKNVLNDASNQKQQGIMPDDSQSRIQAISGKSGWCYIGEDNGFRACSEIGVNDKCMSGEIYPTRDICMNPSLRL